MDTFPCTSCRRPMPEEEFDAYGTCGGCRNAAEFESTYAEYTSSYDRTARESRLAKAGADLHGGAGQVCPRCEAATDRLVGVTGRAGQVDVCTDCRSEALASDRSFWRWYWKG